MPDVDEAWGGIPASPRGRILPTYSVADAVDIPRAGISSSVRARMARFASGPHRCRARISSLRFTDDAPAGAIFLLMESTFEVANTIRPSRCRFEDLLFIYEVRLNFQRVR